MGSRDSTHLHHWLLILADFHRCRSHFFNSVPIHEHQTNHSNLSFEDTNSPQWFNRIISISYHWKKSLSVHVTLNARSLQRYFKVDFYEHLLPFVTFKEIWLIFSDRSQVYTFDCTLRKVYVGSPIAKGKKIQFAQLVWNLSVKLKWNLFWSTRHGLYCLCTLELWSVEKFTLTIKSWLKFNLISTFRFYFKVS